MDVDQENQQAENEAMDAEFDACLMSFCPVVDGALEANKPSVVAGVLLYCSAWVTIERAASGRQTADIKAEWLEAAALLFEAALGERPGKLEEH